MPPALTSTPSPPPASPAPAMGDGPSGGLVYSWERAGKWAIYHLRIETGEERCLTPLTTANLNGVWSPDG